LCAKTTTLSTQNINSVSSKKYNTTEINDILNTYISITTTYISITTTKISITTKVL